MAISEEHQAWLQLMARANQAIEDMQGEAPTVRQPFTLVGDTRAPYLGWRIQIGFTDYELVRRVVAVLENAAQHEHEPVLVSEGQLQLDV